MTKKIWVTIGILFVGAILFHKPLLLMGCKLALHGAIPAKEGRIVSWEKMQWEEGAIALTDLIVKDRALELMIDRVELRFGGSIAGLCFAPEVTVIHPQLIVSGSGEQEAAPLPFLYHTRFVQPRWTLRNGVLILPSSSRLYVSMIPLEAPGGIGRIALSYDPNVNVAPLLTAELSMQDNNLNVGFRLVEGDLERLLPLTALIGGSVRRDWHKASGEIELEGMFAIDASRQIEEMHFTGHGKNLALVGMGVDVQCDEVQASLEYHGGDTGFFWERIHASALVQGGACAIGAPLMEHTVEVKGIEGQLSFEPGSAPHFALGSTVSFGTGQMAFDLSGKGGLQEDSTVWSEMEFSCTSLTGKKMQGTFSLCRPADNELALRVKVDDADFEHLEFFRSLTGISGQCVDGVAALDATLFYGHGMWTEAFVEQCHLHRMRWYFPKEQMTVHVEELTGDCLVATGPHAKWSLQDLHMQMTGGEYVDPDVSVGALCATVAIEGGKLKPSLCTGEWGSLSTQVAFLGAEGDHVADVKIAGSTNALLALMGMEGQGTMDPLPLNLQAAVQMEESALEVQAEGEIAGDPIRGSVSFLISPASPGVWSGLLAGHLPEVCLKEGTCQSEHLTASTWGQFVQRVADGTVLSGILQCEAHFCPEHIHLKVGGDQLHISHPLAEMIVSRLEEPAQWDYEWPSKKWHGEIPFAGAVLKCTDPTLSFFNVGGSLNFEGSHEGWSFQSNLKGLEFPLDRETSIREGRCKVAFDSRQNRLTVDKAEGIWELKDKTVCTVQMEKCTVALGENPVVEVTLRVADGKKEYAQIGAKAARSLSSGWKIIFDKEVTHFDGMPLNITQCQLNDQFQLSSFAMAPPLRCQDLPEQAAFLQKAGILPQTFSPWALVEWQPEGTLQTQVFSEDLSRGVSFHAQSHDLKIRGQSWTPFQLRAQKIGEKWLIEHLEAGRLMLKGAFVVDGDALTFPQIEGSWEGLGCRGSGWIKPEQKRFACTFDSIRGEIPPLEKLPEGTLVAGLVLRGDFSDPKEPLQILGETRFSLDLRAPFEANISNLHPVHFNYTTSKGIMCSGLELHMKNRSSRADLAWIKAEKLHLSRESALIVRQIGFSCMSELKDLATSSGLVPASLKELEWEGNLEGTGDLEVSKSGPVFQGNLNPGRYGYAGKSLLIGQMQLRVEKEVLSLRVKTQVEEQPLWGCLQIHLCKEPYGALKLFDHPKGKGLKIPFRTQAGRIIPEGLQGSCYGLQCSLDTSASRRIPLATVLTGDVQVDIGTLCQLFPKEVREGVKALKFGSGYQWKGDVVLFGEAKRGFIANGILSGREFEFLGYRFRNLESTLEASSSRVLLSGLRIDDPAGTVGIKTIELLKKDGWSLLIPQLQLNKIKPSLLRKIGITPGMPKPFTIEHCTLTGIRCTLGDTSTLEGSGHLQFVNAPKKGSSILDVPLEMVRKLGLDLGIMTPVQGELQLDLHGDKFYLISLDNAFSEGGRSEFYLPVEKDLSWIDLEGKVHINLRMRQDVMLKITEPFTLTIRGTLDKPRYGLQF